MAPMALRLLVSVDVGDPQHQAINFPVSDGGSPKTRQFGKREASQSLYKALEILAWHSGTPTGPKCTKPGQGCGW